MACRHATIIKSSYYDLIIIGGGASGLFCALSAGKLDKRVLVLDGSNKPGKKILMSGGGRCNFTNLFIDASSYISKNPHFCKSSLAGYTQWDFISLLEEYNISYHERKHGELFCDNSAKDILDMLLAECAKSKVDLHCNSKIRSVMKNNDSSTSRFSVNCENGHYSCRSLVIATGGLSIPAMGVTGFGYDIARQFSLQLVSRRAGLVPFTFSDNFKELSSDLSGLSMDVDLSSGDTGFTEAVLFTHRGLSGPAALQLSNYWQPSAVINIDLFPDCDLYHWLMDEKLLNPRQVLRTILSPPLSKNLVSKLEELFWKEFSDTAIAELSNSALKAVADSLSAWTVKPSGTEGYRTAEVTLGGVSTAELSSKSMECKKHPGLFFIGEVVDVTGHLGGFNFQWAWSSAFAASQYV